MFCCNYDKQYKKREKWVPSSSSDDFEEHTMDPEDSRAVMVSSPKKNRGIKVSKMYFCGLKW